MSTHQTGSTPRKSDEFLAWAKNLESATRSNYSTWGIDNALLDQLSALVTRANTAYAANHSPELKNSHTVEVQRAAFIALRRYAALYINYLESNLKVPDEALAYLQLRPRHPGKHEPIPPPTEAPVVSLVTGQHHDIDIYFYRNQAGHPTEYLADSRYHGVLLQYRFKGEPDWRQKAVTRKHETLIFDDNAEGKYLEVRAAWLNPRLQSGPWSDIDQKLIN